MNTLNRIKEYIIHKGISNKAFEKSVGFSNGAFASQLKNNRTIGVDKLENILLTYPDLNPTWLLTGKGEMLAEGDKSKITPLHQPKSFERNMSKQSIPLYDVQATAGVVRSFVDQQNIIDRIVIPNMPKCDGAMYVVGDSMYPIIKSGDIVLFKEQADPCSILYGNIYVVSLVIEGDCLLMVKYIQRSELEEHIKLVSYNTHHEPVDVHMSNVRAFALVKGSVRFNFTGL